MKITEYLLFAAVMVPTILVILAAAVSLAHSAPQPEPVRYTATVSSAGVSRADQADDSDRRL
jgi:hypothetical protein